MTKWQKFNKFSDYALFIGMCASGVISLSAGRYHEAVTSLFICVLAGEIIGLRKKYGW